MPELTRMRESLAVAKRHHKAAPSELLKENWRIVIMRLEKEIAKAEAGPSGSSGV